MKTLLLALLISIACETKADTVDNYQLYINNILVCNSGKLHNKSKQGNFLALDNSISNTYIDVYFNHCTGGAKKRRIIVISKNNSKVIEWQFPDEESVRIMRVPINRLFDKIKDKELYEIYYYDDQLPEGRLLTKFKIS